MLVTGLALGLPQGLTRTIQSRAGRRDITVRSQDVNPV
jgi:hypothetical protein